MNTLGIIIAREYLERVKRKSFIITTLLMPIIMIGLMAAPTLIAIFSTPESKIIAVIDDSKVIMPYLKSEGEMKFTPIVENLDSAKANESYDAILSIGKDVVSRPQGNISLYTRGAPSIQTESAIAHQIEDAIEDCRIKEYNIDNLKEILAEIDVDVDLETFRIDKEEESATSSIVSYLLGMITMFILYMFILLYGQMVMTSIIEEKNNRVLEIVVSSVKPTYLMMGKILGIGLVAVTQILIWAILIIGSTIWLMPMVSAAAVTSGDPTITAAFEQLGNTSFIATIFVNLTLFLIGGYLFYSSIFAAIGSAVDNIQDASQLQSLAIIPIVLGLIVSTSVVNDPNSSIAVWTSIIPFTSPMVMMARLPFGIPVWQTIVSIIILYASFIVMIWLSAKIYRVGIFMYGKKPTIGELIKWVRYK